MFWQAFRMTGAATLQIFILGLIGYILVKKNILGEAGLDILSRLTIEITLPFLIFYQLISQFSFSMYPNWWLYPVLSILITGIGLALAYCFSGAVAGRERKAQFMSLVAFQNSGYLPLVLIAALLPKDKADPMLVFLFLFLLGFNLVMFSFGAYLLTAHKNKKFELGSLFSPPVVAIILGMLMVYFRLNRFIPGAVIKPVQMIGETTLPLAMLVVGGSLAAARITRVDKKAVFLVSALKLVVMPLLGLVLVIKLNLPELVGLLVLMQMAVPPATSLSVIIRHYKKEDLLVSQGIFFGHLLSLVTLPVFLSIYFTFVMVR